MAVGHATNGMAKDLDRRLGDTRVVAGGTRLTKVLEQPRLFLPRLEVRFGLNAGEIAELSETDVRARDEFVENETTSSHVPMSTRCVIVTHLRHCAFVAQLADFGDVAQRGSRPSYLLWPRNGCAMPSLVVGMTG